MATTRLWTIADLERRQLEDEVAYELIRGELIEVSPAGGRHGRVTLRFSALLWIFVDDHSLGALYSSDTGFVIDREPDTLLQPDIAFIRTERLPADEDEIGFVPVIPDLVVEVRSPTNRPGHVARKIGLYLEAGVPLVWDLDPERRLVRVHTTGQPVIELTEEDTLDGGEVLPGLRLRLSEIFR